MAADHGTRLGRGERAALVVAALGGTLLAIIGVRFLIVPEQAAHSFGLPRGAEGHALHHIVAIRDVWLGLLAVGLVWLRQWPALALWFGLATLVCFADASLVAANAGKWPYVAFHAGSGIICAVLTVIFGRRAVAAASET